MCSRYDYGYQRFILQSACTVKVLKISKTEFAYINELIQTLALVHTNVAFELKNNGKTIIKTTGQGDTLQVLKEVFPKT